MSIDRVLDTALLTSIDSWTDTATEAVLSFWRPSVGDFWRDSHTKLSPTPEPYYPSATFLCIRSLCRPAATYADSKDSFTLARFLQNLKTFGVDSALGESDVNSSSRWNVYTASCLVDALARSHIAVRSMSSRTPPSDQDDLSTWLEGEIRSQSVNINQHLAENRGGALSPGVVHPFLSAVALRALSTAERAGVGVKPILS